LRDWMKETGSTGVCSERPTFQPKQNMRGGERAWRSKNVILGFEDVQEKAARDGSKRQDRTNAPEGATIGLHGTFWVKE